MKSRSRMPAANSMRARKSRGETASWCSGRWFATDSCLDGHGPGAGGQGSDTNDLDVTLAATRPQVKLDARRRIAPGLWPLTADASVVACLLVASLAFYYPLVFLGRALLDYDAFVYFYPQRAYLAQALLAGRIPLW